MQLHIEKNPEQLSYALADWIANYINDVLSREEKFSWALSGGNSPRQLYKLLAESPYRQKIPWSRLHIFFGDERVVPFDDEQNNGRMAFDTLLKQVPVPREQIHFMRTDVDAETSAAEYEKLLQSFFSGKERSFDLVLLGMGEDGHTLSLFPDSKIVQEQNVRVKSLYLPEQKIYRITLMPTIINRAEKIAFLVTGSSKAETLKKVLQGKFEPEKFPAQLIRPESGETYWFVDEAAARLLTAG
jgi:6-phosphogluconolactonase